MAGQSYLTAPFSTEGELGGIGASAVWTSIAGAGADNPPYNAGTTKIGTDGTIWVAVLAATTLNLGDCVSVDVGYNASQMTNALATAGLSMVAFASATAIPSGSYGWVAYQGIAVQGNVLTGTAAGVALYTTATAGVLSSTATSQVQIYGVKAATANSSGSTAIRTLIAPAPRTTN